MWYEHAAFGKRLAELSGWPMFGPDSGSEILQASDPVIIASIKAHGDGKNLQAYSQNLISSPPANGTTWEQCLDSKTEILTEVGWKGIDDEWGPETRAAAFSINDETVRWSSARRIERKLGDEKMYGICNPHLDIRVTSGHRMVHQGVRRFGPAGMDGFEYTPWGFVAASELPQRGRIPLAGDQVAVGVSLTEAELVFLGLFLTDGNLSPCNNAISIFQSEKNPEIIALIEATLKACGFRFGHRVIKTPSNFGPRKHPLHRWSVSFGIPKKKEDRHLRGWSALHAFVDKSFSDALDEMTREQLLFLIKGMWAGNGDKTRGTYSYDRYQAGTMNICTPRESVVNKVQSLCVRRGIRCNVSKIQKKLWMLRISEDRAWTVVNMCLGDGRPRWEVLEGKPTERVWCVEVNTGAIITRRNGKVAIVGNCLGRTHRQGQMADEVGVDVYLHTEHFQAAFDQAIKDSEYVENTQGQRRKLLYATKLL